MNTRLYRLIFSRRLGAFVPTWEGSRARPRGRSKAASAATLAAALAASVSAQAQSLPADVLPQVAANWQVHGQAAAAVVGNTLTVTQSAATPAAILEWNTFNVGANAAVRFVQPSAEASILNRVVGQNPAEYGFAGSIVNGRIEANGQIYLINRNGILFGPGSVVDAYRIIASTLNVTNADYLAGILKAAQEGNPRHVFNAFPEGSGTIRIESLATLQARGSQSRVFVFAPTIENRGTIKAPDGQVMLAAGEKVWLMQSDNPGLRGLLVEVDAPSAERSTATNLGEIIAERGNVTIAGLAVNQGNRVSATTALNANGSIRLLARGAPVQNGNPGNTNGQPVVATRTGRVEFAQDSVTEVRIDAEDKTTNGRATVLDPATGRLAQPPRVEIMGDRIFLRDRARIEATGGDVVLAALKDPSAYNAFTNAMPPDAAASDSRIFLGTGAVIDVRGAVKTHAMEHNQLRVDLRASSELADAPLQKEGLLRSKKIYVDIRTGTPVASIAGALATVPMDVTEALATGGTVTLASEGDVVLSAGSRIDVSGGRVDYRAGFVETTRLIARDGTVHDIGAASPDQVYQAFADALTTWENDPVRRLSEPRPAIASVRQEAYSEGKSAGTITLIGTRLATDGDFAGSVTIGALQRSAPPTAGRLVLGDASGATGTPARLRLGDVQLLPTVALANVGTDDPIDAGSPYRLSLDKVRAGGFGRLEVYSEGRVTLPRGAELVLPPSGSVRLVGSTVALEGRISVPAGTITGETRVTQSSFLANDTMHDLMVGGTATLDARGQWVNDTPRLPGAGAGPIVVAGGRIALQSAGALTVAGGATVDVTGGGRIAANGAFTRGDAGRIELVTQQVPIAFVGDPVALRLEPGARLLGHALGKGGELVIRAGEVLVSGARPAPNDTTLLLRPEQFADSGFAAFDITAKRGALTIAGDTRLDAPRTRLELNASASLAPTGADLYAFSRVTTPPLHERTGASYSFTLDPSLINDIVAVPPLIVEPGAVVDAGPYGRVSLRSITSLSVDGSLRAQSGQITLAVTTRDTSGGVTDLEYQPGQALTLGPAARLDTDGGFIQTPGPRARRTGTVTEGGQITLQAQRGYLVMRPGAVVSASGASDAVDLYDGRALVRQAIGSAAGRIVLEAAEGMVLNGSFAARPGAAGLFGGTLVLTLNAASTIGSPGAPREVTLVPSAPATNTRNGQASLGLDKITASGIDDLQIHTPGSIVLDASGGGLQLALGRRLVLDAPAVELLGPQASIEAPVVAWWNALGASVTASRAGGPGGLRVSGDMIELAGNVALRGTSDTVFTSRGDLRLRGIPTQADGRNVGSFAFEGRLRLEAGQVAPATFSAFTFQGGTGSSITIARSPGARVDPPLSAAGFVRFAAADIVSRGTVLAPFGEIEFAATRSLTLEAGSITSVSGAGRDVLFGTVQNGAAWFYDSALTQAVGAAPQKRVSLDAPTVAVDAGATVDLSGGGRMIAYEWLAGPGGSRDVLGEIGGVAGSATKFAILPWLRSAGPGTDAFGPFDTQEFRPYGSQLLGGEGLWLTGVRGLPDGRYALLPARYALLPGAWQVNAVAGQQDLLPGTSIALATGAQLVAGRRVALGTALADSRTSGFVLQPDTLVAREAEYQKFDADAFFVAGSSGQRLPSDAGALSVAAATKIALDGTFVTNGAVPLPRTPGEPARPAGRRAQIDVTSDRIEIVAALTDGRTDGVVELLGSRLSEFGADSLMIGGTRRPDGNGQRVTVRAASVVLGPGAHLSGSDVTLAARDRVSLGASAELVAAGAIVRSDDFVVGGTAAGSGDGALVRVSTGTLASVTRQNVTARTGNAATDAAIPGEILLDPAARILGSGSVVLDATQDTRGAGTVRVGAGGGLHLGVGLISLGQTDSVPLDARGLVFSNEVAAEAWAGVGRLTLASYGGFDLYGAAELRGVAALTLLGPGLFAREAGGDAQAVARIEAGSLTLANPTGLVRPTGGGTRGLQLTAERDLAFGAGPVAFAGFGRVTASAGSGIAALGTGEVATGGDLALVAPVITGGSGADRVFRAVGRLETALRAAVPGTAPVAGLGAKLELVGRTVVHGGRIVLPSGTVILSATRADASSLVSESGSPRPPADTVTLLGGSEIRVEGQARSFAGQAATTPGGVVRLVAASGNVRITDANANLPAAKVDVSGAASGGQSSDAGSVQIVAPQGRWQAGGELRGTAGAAGKRSGDLALDVGQGATTGGSSASATELLDAVARASDAGGFHERLSVRLRDGAMSLAAGTTLSARQITLAADKGAITLAGTLDASGPEGGRIEVWARDALAVAPTARLLARASDAGARGGDIVLGTSTGSLALQAAAARLVFDVSGGAGAGRGGDIVFRVPRNAANTQVAITAFEGTFRGQRRLVVEAVRTYTDDDLGASDLATTGTMFRDTQNFMARLGTIRATLGRGTDATFRLLPGIEIQRSGTLTLSAPWSLHAWKFDPVTGAPVTNVADLQRGTVETSLGGNPVTLPYFGGVLTLRAGGDLRFNQSLSDGFTPASLTADGTTAATRINDGGESWSYRLVAGAETDGSVTGNADSANPMAVRALESVSTLGNLVIAAGSRPSSLTQAPTIRAIRTGTGDIDIATARDVTLTNMQSVIYTAGVALQRRTGANAATAAYSQDGGDIRILAQRDITLLARTATGGPAPVVSDQVVTGWLHRDGTTTLAGSYWVDTQYFQQGVGALAGGDVTVSAGRDIASVSFSSAASQRRGEAAPTGSGDIVAEVGRDIRSGVWFVANGTGSLSAGREVGRRASLIPADRPLYPILALGSGTWDVEARAGAGIETTLNPTVIMQGAEQNAQQKSFFFTYDEGDRVRVASLTGDVVFGNNTDQNTGMTAPVNFAQGTSVVQQWGFAPQRRSSTVVYPGQVRAEAFGGSVQIGLLGDFITLFPSRLGTLELLAENDVRFGSGSTPPLNMDLLSTVRLNLSDADRALLPSLSSPATTLAGPSYAPLNPQVLTVNRAAVPVHAGSPLRAAIVANSGDVVGGTYFINMPLDVVAGGDVRNASFRIQHADKGSASRIHAGGDVVFDLTRNPQTNELVANERRIALAGPGRLEVSAGGDIDLGNAFGIVSIANAENPALDPAGASIDVFAGVATPPDFDAFLTRYAGKYASTAPRPLTAAQADAIDRLDRFDGTPVRTLDDLDSDTVRDVANLRLRRLTLSRLGARQFPFADADLKARGEEPWLADYFDFSRPRNGFRKDGSADALALFEQRLWDAQQIMAEAIARDPRAFALDMFYNELKLAGGLAATLAVGPARDGAYAGGDLAAATLMPNASGGRGDVRLFFSQIRTALGGDINLLVPGGLINAGLANPPSGFEKPPSQLGVVAQGVGRVQSYSEGDFVVNQSRVFTLRGGDLTLWSAQANIDAGRGKKTAVSAPPPLQLTDASGNVTFIVQGAAVGSGIQAITTFPDDVPGTVDLIAPRGIVDAGDAGIQAAGRLNIVAVAVANAGNIQASGGSNVTLAAPASPAVGGITNPAADATKSSERATESAASRAVSQLRKVLPSFITVEVIGMGDEQLRR